MSELEKLKEQVAVLETRAQVQRLQAIVRRNEYESQRLQEGWGDLIDPLEPLRGDPDFFGEPRGGRISRPDDRRNGDFKPVFDNEHTLAIIRGAAEMISATDSTAGGILEDLTSYALDTGFTYSVVLKGANKRASSQDPLVQAVQRVVDEFCDRTHWKGRLGSELFKRLRVQGERFVELVDAGNGKSVPQIHEPSWITEPDNPRAVEYHFGLDGEFRDGLDWKYGVATIPQHPEEVVGFFSCRYGVPDDWEFVSADRMTHSKVNVDSNVKRGLSDFYAGQEWLTNCRKLLRRTMEGGIVQSSIAGVRQWEKHVGNDKIESAAQSKVEFHSRLPTQGSATNVGTQRFWPGTIIDAKGFVFEAGPMGQSQAPTYIEILQAGLRAAGRRWSMPEFMTSADASNANYSSTLVAESPFVKFIRRTQAELGGDDVEILWRVVSNAVRAGVLPGPLEVLKSRLEIKANPPDVQSRDPQIEHQIRKEQNQAGILSLHTWSDQEGLDYDEEQGHIESEPQKIDPMLAQAMGTNPDGDGIFPESVRTEEVAQYAINRLLEGK